MARTFRKSVNYDWNNGTGHYIEKKNPDGKGTPEHMRRFRGAMLMAASVCGFWNDERPRGGKDRKQQRRNVKRSERQNWRKNIDKE